MAQHEAQRWWRSKHARVEGLKGPELAGPLEGKLPSPLWDEWSSGENRPRKSQWPEPGPMGRPRSRPSASCVDSSAPARSNPAS